MTSHQTSTTSSRILTGGVRHLSAAWSSLNPIYRWFVGLMVLRWMIDTILLLNLLPLMNRDGWYLHHGGDQLVMFELAQSVVNDSPVPSVVGFGQSMVMIPWIMLLRPDVYKDIVAPLVIINGFILGGASILMVGALAKQLTNNRFVAISSAALWSIMPLLGYFGFIWHPEWVLLRSSMTPKLGWLNGLSDPPASFMMLLAFFCLVYAVRHEKSQFWIMLGTGVALGVAISFRAHVVFYVAFLLIYVWAAYDWQALSVVTAGGLLTYIPQAWYNLVVFNIPITTGYISIGDIAAFGGTLRRPLPDLVSNLWFHPSHLVDMFSYFIGRRVWLLIPLGLGLIVLVFAAVILLRSHGPKLTILVLGGVLFYLGPLMTSWNFRDDVVRFMMPVIPLLIILFFLFVADLKEQLLSESDN